MPDNVLSIEIYRQICENIRDTDDISFKLLGAIPASAAIGSGTLAFLQGGSQSDLPSYPSGAIFILSFLGFAITYGLYRWEVINIRKCNWLISRGANMKRLIFSGLLKPSTGTSVCQLQFDGSLIGENDKATVIRDIKFPSIFECKWTHKAQAATVIYLAAMAAWLVPMLMAIAG